MKKFGNIELGGEFGGYEIINHPVNKLPQDVASAVGIVNSSPLLGATYNPIWYIGKQLVNGVNHFFIAEDVRATKNKDKLIVGLIINIPPGEGAIKGEGAKVVKIIEDADLAPEVKVAFAEVEKGLVGVSYKPVAYIGSQTVRGINHYIVCEAKVIYPGAQPRAVVVGINIFEGKASLICITPIPTGTADGQGLFGYSFTW